MPYHVVRSVSAALNDREKSYHNSTIALKNMPSTFHDKNLLCLASLLQSCQSSTQRPWSSKRLPKARSLADERRDSAESLGDRALGCAFVPIGRSDFRGLVLFEKRSADHRIVPAGPGDIDSYVPGYVPNQIDSVREAGDAAAV